MGQGTIVQGRPLHGTVIEGEGAGLDHIQRHVQAGGEPDGRTYVLRNVWLKKRETHSKRTPYRGTARVVHGRPRSCGPAFRSGMSFKVADSLAHTASVTDGPADPGRRDFIHIAATAAAVGGVAMVAWPLIDQLNPAADTLALASLEYDIRSEER